MKKTYLVILITILSIPFILINTHFARAEGVYLRVINDSTPFYENTFDDKPLFYLPYTYYVKVIDETTDFVHVECFNNLTPTIDGYVPKTMLFSDGLTVISPYLSLSLTTIKNCTLYQNSACTIPLRYVFANRTVSYYGKAETLETEVVYCVNYNGQLGYIMESDIAPFTISNHPNELTFLKKNETPSSQTAPQFNSLKIIIISCLIFAGIIALVVAFTPKNKRKKRTDYYDENDYE